MAEDPVSIAIVGAGLVGRRHLAALTRVPGARLAALVDPDPAAEALAAAAGAPWRRELADCLARDRPEAVILATPNHLHADQGLACVAADVTVLVEKPIAEASGPARALVEAAEAAGVPLMVGHHRRHNPLVAAIKARIEAGEIGAVRAVNALCWLMKPDDYFAAAWRTGPGAGPVFINLIHDIDLMRHFAGEVSHVQAHREPGGARPRGRGHRRGGARLRKRRARNGVGLGRHRRALELGADRRREPRLSRHRAERLSHRRRAGLASTSPPARSGATPRRRAGGSRWTAAPSRSTAPIRSNARSRISQRWRGAGPRRWFRGATGCARCW